MWESIEHYEGAIAKGRAVKVRGFEKFDIFFFRPLNVGIYLAKRELEKG